MTRAPFEPLGEKARWRVVYDLLRTTPEDGVITYEAMAEALALDPDKDRPTIQQAVHRAAREFEEADKHAIDVVRGQGYRVVRVREHLTLAKRHQKRSRRSLERGQSKVVNVDLGSMEPEVRKAFEVLAQGFALQADFNRRIETRQTRLDAAIREITDAQSHDRKRTDEEMDELRERLARLERGSE
jgi:hypothetical protein